MSYNRNSERFLVGLIKASKNLQTYFYSHSAFVEWAMKEPFSLYKHNGQEVNVIRVEEPKTGNPFYPGFEYGHIEGEQNLVVLYTRHKQKQRFSNYEFHQQGTLKFKKRTQKFGYTYTFYTFPKSLLTVFNQYKDSFDIVLDFEKTIKYLDLQFLNQGLEAL